MVLMTDVWHILTLIILGIQKHTLMNQKKLPYLGVSLPSSTLSYLEYATNDLTCGRGITFFFFFLIRGCLTYKSKVPALIQLASLYARPGRKFYSSDPHPPLHPLLQLLVGGLGEGDCGPM